MDEQLEQPIERGGAEAQPEETILSPAGEEAAKEAAERTDNPETEVKTESSAEEKDTPNAELSASQNGELPSPHGEDHDARPDVRRSQLAGPLAVDEVLPAAAASHKGGEEGAYVIGSELDAAKKIAQLPTSMQARYNDLPKTAQRALIK